MSFVLREARKYELTDYDLCQDLMLQEMIGGLYIAVSISCSGLSFLR